MNKNLNLSIVLLVAGSLSAQAHKPQPQPQPQAQSQAQSERVPFSTASAAIHDQLRQSLDELGTLQEQIGHQKLPLVTELGGLEAELLEVRKEYQAKALGVDRGNLDLSTLQADNRRRRDEATYLSNLIQQYIREFETRLLAAEKARYAELLDRARLATENSSLPQREIYAAQADVVTKSIERLHEAIGGAVFPGKAVDVDGLIRDGSFAVVGPATIFRSADGAVVGTTEQRLDAVTPAVLPFADPADAAAANALIVDGAGVFPFDATLGNAHKMAATEELFLEHIEKGGPVMVPIFVMAGLALLVALYKWISMAMLTRPSKQRLAGLLDAVARGDHELAQSKAHAMRGPTGAMLAGGADHLDAPKELIEEVMYEKVLATRLQVQRLLPFIAICAASAPLLGLLGTVTGIINTFKLITVFGSGDVKTLSGGISEALITTKFGLIVAIPSLLLHAYLSRMARGIVGTMERAGISFLNQVSRARSAGVTGSADAADVAVDVAADAIANGDPAAHRRSGDRSGVEPGASVTPDPELVRRQVGQILEEILTPLVGGRARSKPGAAYMPPKATSA